MMKSIMMLLLLMFPILHFNAQENAVLTLMTPSSDSLQLKALLAAYQQTHPTVEIRTMDFPEGAIDIFERLNDRESYLDAWASLASQADVILIDRYAFGIEATRAHYFLDLKPLIDLEPQLEDSIYPVMWQSFSWDNGLWGIPVYAAPLALGYDPEAFDIAGLSYPQDTWRGHEYLNAVVTLSEETTPAAFISEIDIPMWLSLISSTGFTYDEAGRTSPLLNTPELTDALSDWAKLAQSGALSTLPSQETSLRITRGLLDTLSGFEITPLPSDQIGLNTFGLTISSGTAHPEQAFELARYLATSPDFVTAQTFAFPADRTIAQGHETFETWGSLMNHALPQSVFDIYVVQAWREVVSGAAVASKALENAQNMAEETLALAESRQSNTLVVVPPQMPTLTEPDDIVLNFGIYTGEPRFSLLPQWQNLADEFAESEQRPVEVIVTHYPSTLEGFERMEKITTDMDCFYVPAYQSENYLSEVLSLDPLLDTDPTFDPTDILPGLLDQVQYDHRIIGLPVNFMPTVMYANEDLFEEAGLNLPESISTIEGFVTTLEQLAPLMNDQEPLYPAATMLGDHLVLLMAAYGAVPLDFSQTPPVVNFTNPSTVEYIRQILDLARDGYIYYQPTVRGIQRTERPNQSPALLTHLFFSDGPNPYVVGDASYRLVLFPSGRDVTPVSSNDAWNIYISAESLYPETCYKFAREIALHPELYRGFPAYRSVIDSNRTEVARGSDDAVFYRTYMETLVDEHTVVVNWESTRYPEGNWWLKRAFDRYVLEDADLEIELAEAEQFTHEYITCMDNSDEPIIPGYPRCALEIDPSIVETYYSD